MLTVRSAGDREIILKHAEMVLRLSEESVTEPFDRQDVAAAHEALVATAREMWEG